MLTTEGQIHIMSNETLKLMADNPEIKHGPFFILAERVDFWRERSLSKVNVYERSFILKNLAAKLQLFRAMAIAKSKLEMNTGEITEE